MRRPAFLEALKPNIVSFGYGLFLAINAASVWGGTFPFLPMDFQTSEVLLWFYFAQSLVFALSFFTSALGTYLFPSLTRTFSVKLVVAIYMLGWCFLIGALYFRSWAVQLSFVGGGFLGLGSAGFYMLWQRLFASQDAVEGNRNLIVGTAWAVILYFALYLIPVAVTAYLIPLVFLPLFSLIILLQSRTIDLDQPMFEDVPSEHPRTYRHVISHVWRMALAIGALGFCTGIMRSFAVSDSSLGSFVNMLSMIAMLVAVLLLLTVWTEKNIRFNVHVAYRIFFPLVTTAFLLLPFLGAIYIRVLAAVLYALWSVAIVLMMIQCAQVSRDGGVNPVFIYGLFGGIVYVLHDVGFIGGHFMETLTFLNIPPVALVTAVAIYLLGIMYFVGQGGFRSAISIASVDEIELLVMNGNRADRHLSQGGESENISATSQVDSQMPYSADDGNLPLSVASPAIETEGSCAKNPQVDRVDTGASDAPSLVLELNDVGKVRDRFSKQMTMVREFFGLSAREAEVAELIARGYTVAHIAEQLFVSENTVRTHSKHIYTKLGIHKRQELIALVESFEPEGF